MRAHDHLHRKDVPPAWVDQGVAWLIIAVIVAANLIMMWRIATATV